MTPTEYGEMLADRDGPVSDECAEAAARIMLAAERLASERAA